MHIKKAVYQISTRICDCSWWH